MTEQQKAAQEKSLSDLESDIAKSRERLAATIDELAYRAQPKNIVAAQKRQLRDTLRAKYNSFMGTSSESTTEPSTTIYRGERTTTYGQPSTVDQAKAKAEELKATAADKLDELKARTESHGQHADTTGQTSFADLRTRAQVKADQARLKLDEATHDADGELRADRVATGLAVAGAVLVSLGVARRNRG
ncbi:DUF3618 domain-containing protein [Arsenicicoccus sp. oral taxon 190]|uniref:DUF3618 domain-containing protein n=1 Tax=Arsenicicoccus sp. oral taxon 190 TaxID=1658671 RepID=UPI00067A2702|nr:DUF3618 domain-containing protein [Arsenicicoccus sp. oral taxon 190]AKT51492.1 hypothetical protein ADJ73_09490 [Arsenicicoccus sp. oral taxon 190]